MSFATAFFSKKLRRISTFSVTFYFITVCLERDVHTGCKRVVVTCVIRVVSVRHAGSESNSLRSLHVVIEGVEVSHGEVELLCDVVHTAHAY